jgi:hypothetical protein
VYRRIQSGRLRAVQFARAGPLRILRADLDRLASVNPPIPDLPAGIAGGEAPLAASRLGASQRELVPMRERVNHEGGA